MAKLESYSTLAFFKELANNSSLRTISVSILKTPIDNLVLLKMLKQGGTFGIIILCGKILGDKPYTDLKDNAVRKIGSLSASGCIFKQDNMQPPNEEHVKPEDNKPN